MSSVAYPASARPLIGSQLALQLWAVYVRIDSIEEAIRLSGVVVVSLTTPATESGTPLVRTTSASAASWSLTR